MVNMIFLLETSSDILSNLFVKWSLLSIKMCSFDLCGLCFILQVFTVCLFSEPEQQ